MTVVVTPDGSRGLPFAPSGALIIDRPHGGSRSQYRLTVYAMPGVEAVRVKLWMLDRYRLEAGPCSIDADVILSPLGCEHDCHFATKVKARLGDDVWRGEC